MAGRNNSNPLKKAHESFVDHLRGHGRSISTILAYGKDVSQLIDYLEKKSVSQITEVTRDQLEGFKEDLSRQNYTAKSVSRKLNSIKTFFRFLQAEGLIEEDPATSVSHPTYEAKPPRILSKMEYRALRDACRDDGRIAAIVELMLQTGIRIGEVSRLELEDLKKEEIFIKTYQSQPPRTIPLNKAAKGALERYLQERPNTKAKAVFVTKTGRPFLARNIRAAINRYFHLAGIDQASVNDLRNTWLAHHLASGTSAVFLAKIAGHKRLATTERYLEYLKDLKEKPTEKEKTRLEEL